MEKHFCDNFLLIQRFYIQPPDKTESGVFFALHAVVFPHVVAPRPSRVCSRTSLFADDLSCVDFSNGV